MTLQARAPRIVLLLLALLFLSATATKAPAQSTRPSSSSTTLLLTGDEARFYSALTSRQAVPGGTVIEGTGVYLRRSGEAKWLFLDWLGARATDLTIWRGQAVVLLENGGWRTVYPGGSSAGLPPPPGHRLQLLAGSDTRLFALARREPTDTDPIGSERVLELTPRGGWTDLGAVADAGAARDLAVIGDSLHYAFVGPDGTVKYQSAALPLSAAPATTTAATAPAPPPAALSALEWATPRSLAAVEPQVAQLRLLELGGVVGLWVDPGQTSGGSVYLASDDFSVEGRINLGPKAGEAAVAGNRLRLLYSEPNQQISPLRQFPDIMEQVWDFAGKPLGEAVNSRLPPEPEVSQRVMAWAQGLAMAGLMLAVLLAWRKRAGLRNDQLETAFRLPLAPRGRRLMAGIVDCSPWLAAWAVIFYTSEGSVEQLPNHQLLLLLFSTAVVVTHTLLTEVIFGRTLGKALFGLRVVGMDGKPPAPGAVVVRNLCRVVDLVLLLSFIALFLSPLRQSIGDGAAGTLVLDDDPPTDREVGDGE